MKKFGICISLIAMVLSLAVGCSNSQSTEGQQAENGNAAKGLDFPKRPITVMVPWGTGGGSDQMVRALTSSTEKANPGLKFVVQNMPGAAGLTGLNYVMQQPEDGYMLYEVLTDQLVQMATGETNHKLDDIVPVVQTQSILNFLYIKGSETRFTNFDELVEYAKQHDGEVKVGTTGLNSFDTVMLSAIEKDLGIKFKNVPFNNPAERYAGLQGGFIDVLFEQIGDVKQFVESGEFKPVLVYHNEKVAAYPDVPTTVEKGIDETTAYSRGIWVKKGTPQEVIDYLNEVFKKGMETEEWKKFNEMQVALPTSYQDSEGFKASLTATYEKIQTAVKQ